jgi:hypothetical protein
MLIVAINELLPAAARKVADGQSPTAPDSP